MSLKSTKINDLKTQSGFTLMEMLVVLVLIGLIAMVAIPQITRMLGSAKSKAATIQMETLSTALRFYQLDVGEHPSSSEGLEPLWSANNKPGWNGPYIRQERQLQDPWGNAFVYRAPGTNGPYDLISLGADNKEGGDGENADITAIP